MTEQSSTNAVTATRSCMLNRVPFGSESCGVGEGLDPSFDPGLLCIFDSTWAGTNGNIEG